MSLESQGIAQNYGAICTPDFFGYNKNNELQYRLGKHDEAIEMFDQAIKLEPNDVQYQNNKDHVLKSKPNIRKGWSEKEKKQIRMKQDGKCAICLEPPPRWDYHHLDGNRSNDSLDNCQGLCPNCHSVKTHEE